MKFKNKGGWDYRQNGFKCRLLLPGACEPRLTPG